MCGNTLGTSGVHMCRYGRMHIWRAWLPLGMTDLSAELTDETQGLRFRRLVTGWMHPVILGCLMCAYCRAIG